MSLNSTTNYFVGPHWPKGQHRPNSKIVNFHPIHLKFEEELHIWSLNSTTNYCWGQICFMDFANIVLCTTSSSCLFVGLVVCLFVFEQNISKSCGRIWTKFGGELGYVTRMKWLDFGEDLNPDLDLIIFEAIPPLLRDGAKDYLY